MLKHPHRLPPPAVRKDRVIRLLDASLNAQIVNFLTFGFLLVILFVTSLTAKLI